MAYNKAKEEYRWNQWKAEEEKILREQGVDEETIQKLREYDWDDFNAERRFREHQTSLLDCMELLLEEKETKESQPESVEALLDTVENEELLMVTGGRGWYQEEGKPARELKAGDVVNIPPEVKHWHGAAKDSWFQHLAVEVPAEGASNEWLEFLPEEEYDKLP